MKNPFTENFGQIPKEFISRDDNLNEIFLNLDGIKNISNIHVITGPRGCGKTVSLTSIGKKYKDKDEWIVVDINPLDDIFLQLASQLYDKGKLKKLFIKKEFNFGFKHLSLNIHGSRPVTSIQSLIDLMFCYLKKKEKKVLIIIDEVSNNNQMQIFAHSFQSYLRNCFDVHLVMTGLYKNVIALEKHKQLTFLLRATKIHLEPLSIRGVVNKYKQIFKISDEDAIQLAKTTKGYGFAFQALGNILFEHNCTKMNSEILDELDTKLHDCVYSKIWDDLSPQEKNILIVMTKNSSFTSSDIAKNAKIKIGTFQVLKSRLIHQGIICSHSYNKLSFSLPRFSDFITFISKLN